MASFVRESSRGLLGRVYTIVMRPHFDLPSDGYSERKERRNKRELTRKTKIINVGQTDKVNGNKVNGDKI